VTDCLGVKGVQGYSKRPINRDAREQKVGDRMCGDEHEKAPPPMPQSTTRSEKGEENGSGGDRGKQQEESRTA